MGDGRVLPHARHRQSAPADARVLAGPDIGLLTGLERRDLDGAAGHRNPSVRLAHRHGEMRALDDGGEHRGLDREMLDILLLDVEGHRTGLFQHRCRQALARLFADRHDARGADHHRLGAALERHAGAQARVDGDARRDHHADSKGRLCVLPGPGLA